MSDGYRSAPMTEDRLVLSPSQIRTFRQCLRKGAIHYTLRVPSILRPWFKFGLTGHKYLEEWFKHGTEIDTLTKEGSLAHKGLDFLPERGTTAPPEGEFEFELCEGIYMRGAIDLYTETAVYDYKFNSDMTYAMSPEELADDIQANVYCYHTKVERAWWLYFQKRKKIVSPIGAEMPLDKTTKYVRDLIPEARLIRDVRSLPAEMVNQIPHNPECCEYEGIGCDFVSHCNIMEGSQMDAELEKKLADLKAKAAEKSGQPVVNPPEASKVVDGQTAPEAAGEVDEVAAAEQKLAALKAKKVAEEKAAKAKVAAERKAGRAAKAASATATGDTTIHAPAGSTITVTIKIEPAA